VWTNVETREGEGRGKGKEVVVHGGGKIFPAEPYFSLFIHKNSCKPSFFCTNTQTHTFSFILLLI
jgi:hypothetical protein